MRSKRTTKGKFFKTPINLEAADLIELMRLCFRFHFELIPELREGEVCLYCRRNFTAPALVEFWFSVRIGNGIKNYSGHLAGGKDGHLNVAQGVRRNSIDREIEDDWGQGFFIEIWEFYAFFKKRDFFKGLHSRPIVASIFEKDLQEWIEVYRVKYGDNSFFNKLAEPGG